MPRSYIKIFHSQFLAHGKRLNHIQQMNVDMNKQVEGFKETQKLIT